MIVIFHFFLHLITEKIIWRRALKQSNLLGPDEENKLNSGKIVLGNQTFKSPIYVFFFSKLVSWSLEGLH